MNPRPDLISFVEGPCFQQFIQQGFILRISSDCGLTKLIESGGGLIVPGKKERQRQMRLVRFWCNDLNNRVNVTTVNTPRQVDDVGPKSRISDGRLAQLDKRLVILAHS